MKCVIEKVSWSYDNETWEDIASIDQLKDLIKEVDEEIIISIDDPEIDGNDYLHIRIYDNYVE